jgi:1,4-alpha-glucan branching enzyme
MPPFALRTDLVHLSQSGNLVMATRSVELVFATGLTRPIFRNVRLVGSWDAAGRFSADWSTVLMRPATGDDGCVQFTAVVALDAEQTGWQFSWGVVMDGPSGVDFWGIPTEVQDRLSRDRTRSFVLGDPSSGSPQVETYYLTQCRRLGAQKRRQPGNPREGILFAVWAPDAIHVDVVFGDTISGYIADNGDGMAKSPAPIALRRASGGIWQAGPPDAELLRRYEEYDRRPYMFRITEEGGRVVYRTDLYSRSQIGRGDFDPKGMPFHGSFRDLDGSKSCSMVRNPDVVSSTFADPDAPGPLVNQEEFWADEFTHGLPIPFRLEEMVIYELHVGALGFEHPRAGDLEDAMNLLDYLVDLGINAVELLPMAQFEGSEAWGYGNSHHFAIESAAGGRGQLKHFVRACHQRGIALILDVVYNHFTPDAERAEWSYDAEAPDRNIYYWYEGHPDDYTTPDGGYLDNGSSGYAPRLYEEMVRKLFISSAAALVEEFHVDGFRVDLTDALHLLNRRHADGAPVDSANMFGVKFLTEWTRTMKMIRPTTLLIAEDHTRWDAMTEPPDDGGVGFDAVWYSDFHHHLVGNPTFGPEFANLIVNAGYGDDRPLAMDYFAGALGWSGHAKVVYHLSHDEAGNAKGSSRTICAAVNGAPLVGATRAFAEARCRFAAGMSILSAGTPMFLMGEEVGASKPYAYDTFMQNREDLRGLRDGEGRHLFELYRELIRFRLGHEGLQTREIDVVCANDADRVIAFRRWSGAEDFLIVASLNNRPFREGYSLDCTRIPDARWREEFNSDDPRFGGDGVGNGKQPITSQSGRFVAVVPANGFVIFRKELT